MILHPDGSPMLSHFIRPEYLVALFQSQAFCLIRLDQQSDRDDGKLPSACFDRPHVGDVEHALGLSPKFLRNQAEGLAELRRRTFIMSWTHTPSEHMRQTYGENGRRCELRASELSLKRMLGYEWFPEAEFPPRRRAIPEIPGGRACAQLKEPLYTPGTEAIPVIPAYNATAHKLEGFAVEEEVRIEAIIELEGPLPGEKDILIRWSLASFAGLSVGVGSLVSPDAGREIERLASRVGVSVRARRGSW